MSFTKKSETRNLQKRMVTVFWDRKRSVEPMMNGKQYQLCEVLKILQSRIQWWNIVGCWQIGPPILFANNQDCLKDLFMMWYCTLRLNLCAYKLHEINATDKNRRLQFADNFLQIIFCQMCSFLMRQRSM